MRPVRRGLASRASRAVGILASRASRAVGILASRAVGILASRAGWILALWDELWFAPASPYPLAAFRILLGAYLVVYLGALAPYTTLLFSSQGVYLPYLMPDPMPPPAAAVLLFAALWLLSLALLLGFHTRWTIPLLIVVYLYHYFLALGVKHSSFERLILIYLLALAPSNADVVWSISPPSAAKRPTLVFAGRLIRFQTVLLYFGAGLWKAVNPVWSTGTLLYCTLQGIWAAPLAFGIVRLGLSEATWTLASYGVIAGEMLLGVLLLFRRTRWVGIALGLLFHLTNSVILSIPEFLVCLAPYPLFLPGDSVERLGKRLLELVKLGPATRERSQVG
jgi:hypothetical protein